MFGSTFEDQEARLQKAARELPYPETPDIAAAVMRRMAASPTRMRQRPGPALRRLTWAAAVIGVILLGLLAVPSVRAAIAEFIQIGVVRIFLVSPTPTLTPVPSQTSAAAGGTASPEAAPTKTPGPTPTLFPWLLDIDGNTTLEHARGAVDFAIPLPTYPADLGEPDHVFLQDMDGPVVILVWLEPEQPNRIRLSLHMYGLGTYAEKMEPRTLGVTEVNGQPALWTTGPYILRLRNGDMDMRRLINGRVLIWEQGSITYRLETALEMEEAVKIAESLQ